MEKDKELQSGRALATNVDLIVADEPTGNLDTEIAAELVALLHDISKSGTSVIMATHNMNLVEKYPAKTFVTEGEKLVLS